LQDKPRFIDIADDLMNYLQGAELIIHNAPFDVGFLDHELKLLADGRGVITDHCLVTDTLVMARKMHPGQKNNLDALCKRYDVSNTHRDLHGALLDAEILSDVYLRMTGGQVGLALDSEQTAVKEHGVTTIARIASDRPPLRVVNASEAEVTTHAEFLKKMGGACLWTEGARN
jgi:DNA polymerase-3 subunit epsilon